MLMWLPLQKAQRSIMNFKRASMVLVETLSGGPVLPISDVHWTPPFSSFYKLNVDAACPIDGDKLGIGVVVRDNEGVVVGASSWQVFSFTRFRGCRSFSYAEGFEICKRHGFYESYCRI
jgi:hypothetical protein